MPPGGTTVKGLVEAKDKLEQVVTDLRGEEFVRGMRQSVLMVTRSAKMDAPRDTGRLVNSITGEVRQVGKTVQGVVGSNVEYAPYMELGTGTFAGKPAHFPPPAALTTWARRHGMNPYVVARAIYLRGGLRPRHFFKNAFEKNQGAIRDLIGDTVSRIVRK